MNPSHAAWQATTRNNDLPPPSPHLARPNAHAMNAPPSNPFQLFKPHGLHYFQGVIFNDDDNDLFFNAVAQMREAFSAALDSGKSQEFVKAFTHLTTHMLAASREKTTLYRLFEDALWRLLVYLFHLRARSRAHFCEQASVYRFELDPALLADPRAQIDTMESQGQRTARYDLNRSSGLKQWVTKTLQPLIEEYVGYRIYAPGAELRYANSELHLQDWKEIRLHRYSNFHYDQFIVAYPMAIYLDGVDEQSGPFSYVDGSDKISLDYVCRALHSALTFGCQVGGMSDQDFAVVGTLPAVFRGGDLVGAYAGTDLFERSTIVEVKGAMGTGVLFNGFHLVHSGGKPQSGKRKSMFINFKYPMHKIWQWYGRAATGYWKYRTRHVAH